MTSSVIKQHNLVGSKSFFESARNRYSAALRSNDAVELSKFSQDLSYEILTKDDYHILIREQYWDLMYIPFILNGFKIFQPTINDQEIAQRTLIESWVYSSFCQVFNAIMERKLSIESDSSISIPLDVAIQNPKSFIFEKLIKNLGNCDGGMSVLINLTDLIECCVLESILLHPKLCDVLGIYSDLQKNVVRKPEVIETRFLGIAQVLWFYYPDKNKSQIYKDHLWELIAFKPYSKSAALEKLSLIDPKGAKRKPGRESKDSNSGQNEPLFRKISGICCDDSGQKKISLKRAYILIGSMTEALKMMGKTVSSSQAKDHHLFNLYFKGAHPIVQKIIDKWIKRLFRESPQLQVDFSLKDMLGVDPIVLRPLPSHIKDFKRKTL